MKYRLIIRGENFMMKEADFNAYCRLWVLSPKVLIKRLRNFIRITKLDSVRKYGFFTTRYVEVSNREDAIEVALESIRAELSPLDIIRNTTDNPPVMHVEDLVELESFGDTLIPGAGFSWYEVGLD